MKLFIFAILVGISSARSSISIADKGFGFVSGPSDVLVDVPFTPAEDQRCAGRNYGGRRCCTPENPCDEGEGDCDGPIDGGTNDGHAGCKGDLVCGSNNCKKFGHYYHGKDDCCEKPGASAVTPAPFVNEFPNAPSQPPSGQRCSGRNFQGRRCCTPENPCNEGEGDCDGPLDGGQNDGNAGCKGDLVCGSNNCKQFGSYFHPKDDCCQRSSGPQTHTPEDDVFGNVDGWGDWQAWSQCSARCGGGTWTRNKFCSGSSCSHTTQSQTQPCNTKPC